MAIYINEHFPEKIYNAIINYKDPDWLNYYEF